MKMNRLSYVGLVRSGGPTQEGRVKEVAHGSDGEQETKLWSQTAQTWTPALPCASLFWDFGPVADISEQVSSQAEKEKL